MKISLSRCIHSSTWFPRFYNPISSSLVWSCACIGTQAKVISGFNGHREYQQPFTSDRENCHDQSCNYNLRICFNLAYVRVTARSRSTNLNYAITRGTVSVTQIINEEICCTRTACDYSSSPAPVSVISLFRLIAYLDPSILASSEQCVSVILAYFDEFRIETFMSWIYFAANRKGSIRLSHVEQSRETRARFRGYLKS